MHARLTNSHQFAFGVGLFLAYAAPVSARESNTAGNLAPLPLPIVISGGTDAERRLIDNILLHQMRGLASNAHPLAITIISGDEMRKLVLSGDGDVDANTGASDTPRIATSAVPQLNPPETAPDNDATPDDPNVDGEVDAIYTEADSSASPTNSNTNRAEITLLKGEDTDDFSEAFLHEFGHHLWFTVVSPPEISEFKALYAQAARAQTFVSDYAAVSAEEDFAESFAYYEMKPKLLAKRDPAAAQYMTQLLARMHAAETNAPAPTIQIVQDSHNSVDDTP